MDHRHELAGAKRERHRPANVAPTQLNRKRQNGFVVRYVAHRAVRQHSISPAAAKLVHQR